MNFYRRNIWNVIRPEGVILWVVMKGAHLENRRWVFWYWLCIYVQQALDKTEKKSKRKVSEPGLTSQRWIAYSLFSDPRILHYFLLCGPTSRQGIESIQTKPVWLKHPPEIQRIWTRISSDGEGNSALFCRTPEEYPHSQTTTWKIRVRGHRCQRSFWKKTSEVPLLCMDLGATTVYPWFSTCFPIRVSKESRQKSQKDDCFVFFQSEDFCLC